MSEPPRPTGRDSGTENSAAPDTEQSRATYESLVNTLPLSVLIKNRELYRVFANEAYFRFRGGSPQELLGKRDDELFPPDIAERFRRDDLQVMESGEVLRDVEETLDAAGHRCWIERIKSPIVDSQQRVIGVQLLFWDVTDRVIAERELRHERMLLQNLLQHIPDFIYFKDRESRFLRISDAMAAEVGLPGPEAATGKTDSDIFSPEHADAAREDEIRVMQTGQPLVDRVEKETWHDREETWAMTTKMPLIDNTGQIVGTFGISRDITELKRSQDELLRARDAADQANRAKSDFLANMSHEIRTPLNAVMGMSELLSQTSLTDEQRDYVELVRDSADSLLRLLNDILDFSKIEARKLELESIPFAVRDTVEKCVRSLSVRAGEKGLELACRIDPNVPARVVGDPGRLRQIIVNLVGNAVKFTESGEVFVEVSLDRESKGDDESTQQAESDSENGRWRLRFSVRDTGVGIPSEKQATVLEAFTQADTSTTRRYGGTGLGLAISRELVELMNGKLHLDSEPGVGTTFSFSLEFEEAPSSKQSRDQLKKLDHLPVLVVDDNSTNRLILQEILSTWGFEPTLAEGGAQALQEIERAKARGKSFPLAILDCMMPEMDGFELAERIREESDEEETTLIILSSASRRDDLARCQEIGVARYMNKPVVQSELLETVLQLLGLQPPPAQDHSIELPPCPPMRVLAAEDGITNQHVLIGMLKAAGHEPIIASDGREAVEKWRSEPVDLILMDMHMPVMDGLEATRCIRKEEGDDRHTPIVAVTAAAMKEDAEMCRQAGMDDYLTKPINARRLQEMILRFAPTNATPTSDSTSALPQPDPAKSDQARTKSKTSKTSTTPRPPQPGHSATQIDVVDLDAAEAALPGGRESVKQLIEVFLPECDSLMETMRAELPSGQPQLVQRSAHTLKGSAKLFAARPVVQQSEQIEMLAKAGEMEAAGQKLPILESLVEQMVQALQKYAHD